MERKIFHRGSRVPKGQTPQREHRAVDGPTTDLLLAIISSRLSRVSLKFSFSQNNDYRVLFREKQLPVSFGAIFSR
jgi:hypothetical protein